MNKKGELGDTSGGDAAISTTNNFTFLKFLIAIIIAVTFLAIPTVKLINSRVVIPPNLDLDLISARVSNVCFVNNHLPFESKDQKIIQESLFNKDSLNNCFEDLSSLKINKLVLQWHDDDKKLMSKEIVLVNGTRKASSIIYVLINMDDKTKKIGTLSVIS